jgi:hypothetical protein
MDDLVYQVGVGGLVAVLLVREVLTFLKGRNGNGTVTATNAAVQSAMQQERWKGVEEALRATTHSIRNNTQVLEGLTHHIIESRREVKEAVLECRQDQRR